MKLRLSERNKDNKISNDLKTAYDALKEISFPLKKISLKIVDEQIAKSRTARGINDSDSNTTNENEFNKPENLDIRLHESLRILSDWISLREEAQLTRKGLPATKEI